MVGHEQHEGEDLAMLESMALRLFDKIPAGQSLEFKHDGLRITVQNDDQETHLTIYVYDDKDGVTDGLRFNRLGEKVRGFLMPATSGGTPHLRRWIELVDLAHNATMQHVTLSDGEQLRNPAKWLDWAGEQLGKAVENVEELQVLPDLVKLRMRLRSMELDGKLTPSVIKMVNAALDYSDNPN